MLKRRDQLRQTCYSQLASLAECGDQLVDLKTANKLLDKDLAQADASVTKTQMRR